MNKAQALSGKSLDYWMYQYAAHALGKPNDQAFFEGEYEQNRFHFSEDPQLLSDLLVKYSIRLQMLGDEWLASTEAESAYGESPILATCRLVVLKAFGPDLGKSL